MRVLIALGGHALLRRGVAIEPDVRQREIDAAAQALAQIAVEHEVVIAHGSGAEVGSILELGLRNALPDREVVTVLSRVVVDGDDAARSARSEPPLTRPHAIVGLRSIRALIDAGALVICATAPITARRPVASTKPHAASTLGPIEWGSKPCSRSWAGEAVPSAHA